MKSYMIVTNDKYELPASDEIVGAEETAKRLGIKLQRLRICLCYGFPKKAKYKAVVTRDRQFEDIKAHSRQYSKKYAMTHDRSDYFRERYRRLKNK